MNELILKARKRAYERMVREAEQRHGFNSSDEDGYAEAEDKIIATAKAAYKAKYNEEYDDLEKSAEGSTTEEQSEAPASEQETEQPPAAKAKEEKTKPAPKKQKEESGPTKSSIVRQIVTDLIGSPSNPNYVSAKAVKTLLEKKYQMQIHTSFCVSLINKTYTNLGIDKPARPKTEKAKTSKPKKTVTSSSEEE